MKYEAWIWGVALVLFTLMSGVGLLAAVPEVLFAVPAALFALGAGAFCLGDNKRRTQARAVSCGLAGMISIMATFHLPLRMGFIASRDSLEKAASEAAGEHVADFPRRAGLYRIVSAEITETEITSLWLAPIGGVQAGFAKVDPDDPLKATKDIRLGGSWRFVVK